MNFLSWPWPLMEVIGENGENLGYEYWYLIDWIGSKCSLNATYYAILTLLGALICIVVPYLMGSVNPAILISKIFYHDDIRDHGSGNAGSTNMLRTYGKKAAAATILLDFGKAILAVVLGHLLLGADGEALAGLFVGFGHMFPIFYRFRGGKGVACFAMVGFVIHPLVFVGLITVFLVVTIGTRYVSMGSVMAALLYPMLIKWFSPAPASLHVAMGVLAMLLVVWMHRENLKRIWNNEESKLEFSTLKRKKRKADGSGEEGKNG